jgi:hypothetical protein
VKTQTPLALSSAATTGQVSCTGLRHTDPDWTGIGSFCRPRRSTWNVNAPIRSNTEIATRASRCVKLRCVEAFGDHAQQAPYDRLKNPVPRPGPFHADSDLRVMASRKNSGGGNLRCAHLRSEASIPPGGVRLGGSVCWAHPYTCQDHRCSAGLNCRRSKSTSHLHRPWERVRKTRSDSARASYRRTIRTAAREGEVVVTLRTTRVARSTLRQEPR